MFNPDLDIKCYPAQQQRFVRSGRAYLKENPSCDSLKEQRFPLEPIGKGKGAQTTINPARWSATLTNANANTVRASFESPDVI